MTKLKIVVIGKGLPDIEGVEYIYPNSQGSLHERLEELEELLNRYKVVLLKMDKEVVEIFNLFTIKMAYTIGAIAIVYKQNQKLDTSQLLNVVIVDSYNSLSEYLRQLKG